MTDEGTSVLKLETDETAAHNLDEAPTATRRGMDAKLHRLAVLLDDELSLMSDDELESAAPEVLDQLFHRYGLSDDMDIDPMASGAVPNDAARMNRVLKVADDIAMAIMSDQLELGERVVFSGGETGKVLDFDGPHTRFVLFGATVSVGETIDPVEQALNKATVATPLNKSTAFASRDLDLVAAGVRTPNVTGNWIARRDWLCKKAVRTLQQESLVLLSGPRGSGKSTLVRHLLKKCPEYRTLAARRVIIDCFALTMASPRTLELEALYAQFDDNEDAYKAFVTRLRDEPINGGCRCGDPMDCPLESYLVTKFAFGGGVVIFDHIDALASNDDIAGWMKSLFDRLLSLNIKVVAVTSEDRDGFVARRLRHLKFGKVEVPRLSLGEIESWWSLSEFEEYRAHGIEGSEVYRVTGGAPRLVRDLGRLVAKNKNQASLNPAQLIDQFESDQAGVYAPELDRLIDVLREHPTLLVRPSDVQGRNLIQRVVQTGAMSAGPDAVCRFVSPILEKRYKKLSHIKHLALMVQTGSLAGLMRNRGLQELITERLNALLLNERLPSRVWRSLTEILRYWGVLNAAVFVRDARNKKLWSKVYVSDTAWGTDVPRGAWPLYSDEKPDFALSVQTGRIVQRHGNTVYLPLATGGGRISVVVACELKPEIHDSDYQRRIELRSLWGLFMAIRPAIALAVERQSHRANTKLVRKTEFLALGKGGANAKTGDLVNILGNVGCAAVTVLDRWDSKWFVAKDHRIDNNNDIQWNTVLDQGNVLELDRIANHPNGRGLVLDESDLPVVFPRFRSIADVKTCVYLMPVWRHQRHACNLVAFSFVGDKALHINGVRQSELIKVAPFLAASAA